MIIILHSFKVSEEDCKKYSIVKEKFDGHLVKRRNVIFERAIAASKSQENPLILTLRHCTH